MRDSAAREFRSPCRDAQHRKRRAGIRPSPTRKKSESVDKSCERKEYRKDNQGRDVWYAESAGRANTATSSTAPRTSLGTPAHCCHPHMFSLFKTPARGNCHPASKTDTSHEESAKLNYIR